MGGFRWLSDHKLADVDVASVPTDFDVGYFVECDLHYPDRLHAVHNAYLLVPEHLRIDDDMLSVMLRIMLDLTPTEHVVRAAVCLAVLLMSCLFHTMSLDCIEQIKERKRKERKVRFSETKCVT